MTLNKLFRLVFRRPRLHPFGFGKIGVSTGVHPDTGVGALLLMPQKVAGQIGEGNGQHIDNYAEAMSGKHTVLTFTTADSVDGLISQLCTLQANMREYDRQKGLGQ